MIYKDAQPNPAHYALAKLEEEGKLRAVITQNIDGLHQKAGSQEVLELHGSVYRNYCMGCHKSFNLDHIMKAGFQGDDCGVTVRLMWSYERLRHGSLKKGSRLYQRGGPIDSRTSYCISSSSLVEYYSGNKLVLINKSSTPRWQGSHTPMIYRQKLNRQPGRLPVSFEIISRYFTISLISRVSHYQWHLYWL